MSIRTEVAEHGILVTRRDDGFSSPVTVTTSLVSQNGTLVEVRLGDGHTRHKLLSFSIPNEHARLFAEHLLQQLDNPL